MPNSGFHGQINMTYHGGAKWEVFPLGNKYTTTNLPNPAFWSIFIDKPPFRKSDQTAELGLDPDLMTQHKHQMRMSQSAGSNFAASLYGPPPVRYQAPNPSRVPLPQVVRGGIIANSIAPFATATKPTCGVFFSRETDNKKKLSGIPPADLVKWRYYVK